MEEFNIGEFLKYYFSRIILVIFFIIFGILGCWYYTKNIQVPKFKSQTSLVLVSANKEITTTDLSLNKNLVSTYREIIKSRKILEKVISNLKLEISIEDLNDMVSVKSTDDTELIIISVVNVDKNLSCNIANEIAKVFIDEVPNYYKIENINILDKAVVADKAYNVNILKQYIIGVGGGFLLGSLIIFTIFYFDDSIKKPEDIEEKIGLSVLSTVPKYKSKGR